MTEIIALESDGTAFEAYIARPDGAPRGGLVVIHEIWGLVDHIRDVADRFAGEGWLVAAPDILSHGGVAPALGAELFAIMNGDDDEAKAAAQPRMREAMAGRNAPDYAGWAVGALRSVVDWLEDQPGVDGRVGVTGFCFGGSYAFLLTASDPRVQAAVPFYGTAPGPDEIGTIAAPVLAIYGGHDPTLIDALPRVRRAMADAGVDFEAVVYPDSAHAFFNDTGRRYNPIDAADAWGRVREFLRTHL